MRSILVFLFTAPLLFTSQVYAQELRFATIAPPGSTWSDYMLKFAKRVETRTGVKIVWYMSGFKGDEPEVAEKIKRGELDGGGLTGHGMGKAIPPIRVLELPFLFRNEKEADFIRSRLSELFDKLAGDFGFKIVAWGESGLVYMFSSKPIKEFEDAKGLKVWMWRGDILAEAIAKATSDIIVPIRMPIMDVYYNLDKFDAFYSTPYATIAFAWYKNIKYMIEPPLTFSVGGIIVSRKVWKSLPEDVQDAMLEEGKAISKLIIREIRNDNLRSIETLKLKTGIKVIKLSKHAYDELKKRFEKVHVELAGKIYPSWLLSEVKRAIAAYRAGK